MPFPAFPSVHVRLTRSQYELIAPGFHRIAGLYAYYAANGVKPIYLINSLHPRPNGIVGKSDQAMMDALLSLGGRLDLLFSTPYASCRTQLSALEIEFLMFAVRVTRKQVEHGHIARPNGYSTVRTKDLLVWLEARRRRAKRCWLFSPARGFYPHMQGRWAKLMPWIHAGAA